MRTNRGNRHWGILRKLAIPVLAGVLILPWTSVSVSAEKKEQETESKDSVAMMKERLPMLSQGQPKPIWQKTLKAEETDFIKFISPDRILAGTLEFQPGIAISSGLGWGPQPGKVILLNAANGEEMWATSRAAFGYPQSFLATDPVILLQGSRACGALNPTDGSQIWVRVANGSRLMPSDDRIIMYSQKKSTVSLSMVNIKDGKEVWSTSMEGNPKVKDVDLDIRTVGQVVLLIRNEVVAIAANTGQMLWRKPFPGTAGPGATTIALEDDLYFTDGLSITRTDPASGNPIWRQDFAGSAVRNLTTEANSAYVVLRQGNSDDSPDAVQALDRNSGKPLWKCPLAESTQSALTIQEGRIYLTTMSQLLGIDASNGSLVFKAAIPPDLQARRLLPDLLRITEDRIVVARETGVLAVQKRDGSLLYGDSVEGASFTSDYTIHKLNLALESVTPLKKRSEFREQNLTSFSQVQSRATLDYQQSVFYSQLAMIRAQKTSPVSPTQNFIRGNPSNWTLHDSMMNQLMHSTADMSAAIQNVFSQLNAISAVETAVTKAFKAERTRIMVAEVSQTFQSHAESLQKDFYIRPRYEVGRGWSLIIVNLSTGKRSEFLLSPDNDPLALSAPNLPAFAIDLSGSRIVAKGLGLDPDRFETYEKRVFTPGKTGMFWQYTQKMRIPYPSLLSFDLTSLPFGPRSENGSSVPKAVDPEKTQLNAQLINAAFECDLETVEKTLKAGADVNAVDEYGQTALMLAVESLRVYAKENIIETLLQRRADPSMRDPNGWTAADHFGVMIFWNAPRGADHSLKLLTKEQKEE
jgi:outer membrane protein assembly factor BamB